ncbi:hypothetical protein SO802_005936 [Lithocarpus litseifolius]|uniref:DUF4371 domain-containing protein n=1 Tax=Lithocarpus litseifolius TaxID=425828 RepID=A0AAW2DMD1_9ROSI
MDNTHFRFTQYLTDTIGNLRRLQSSKSGHEFTIEVEDVDDVFGFGDVEHDFTYFKDRMLSIEMVQSYIGGVKEGRCLNTAALPPDLQCLTYIMIFNLYPVKKMTTINNARAIFLMEIWENIYIDISAHAFNIIVDETRTSSRAKLIFHSLIMRILYAKGMETPQDISLMHSPPAINALTNERIEVHLSGDEEEVDPTQGEPMDTKTEAE